MEEQESLQQNNNNSKTSKEYHVEALWAPLPAYLSTFH